MPREREVRRRGSRRREAVPSASIRSGVRPGSTSLWQRLSLGGRLRWGVALLASVAVLATSVGGWMSSAYLDHNIRSAALFIGRGSPGTEKKDSAGRTPMNVLVIGSDTRNTAADCALGGGCGPGANADVLMVVHLAANRTNATVMSIPRDTITDVPQCTDPADGHVYPPSTAVQINSSLQHGGPGCTVATVHDLTGITIDHFVMVDFSGVVNMSDAVGGVRVCVDNNVYDTYSGLKLSKGSHTLTGIAALEFLRSRHGFGNGGDVAREAAQHVYLSALIRKLKSANTLTNPLELYDLANAATKALTVDTGLAGVSNLIALAGQMNDVPTDKITFITMPNVPYPTNPNWLSPGPDAPAVFAGIAADQSLSGPTPAPTATAVPSPVPTVDPASVTVTVDNGSGYIGRAAAVTAHLQAIGYTATTNGGNAAATSTSRVTYGPGGRSAAEAVAVSLGLPATAVSATALAAAGTTAGVIVTVGGDWTAGTVFPHSTASAAAGLAGTVPTAAPTAASPLNAATASSCVAVGTDDTTQYGTPTQAYAANPQVPNSAP